MPPVRNAWKPLIDIRAGESGRTLSMALYLMLVMFAYYILKPVSRAMFLTEFKVDRLPYLNMLIAAGGGLLAYIYSRLAIRASLRVAVTWAMGLGVGCLVGFWWLVGLQFHWLLYVFNVWVSLFSIILVSQGWLVAANVFDSRAAKRLYGLLGLGAIVGAALGGTFTAFTARLIGSRNLLLASAGLVILAYLAFRCAIAQKGVILGAAGAVESEERELSFADILSAIGRYRHLQVIIGIITLTFLVSTLVEFQFQAMASRAYKGDRLAAFLGTFQGVYVNLVTFPLQFFLTAAVVRRLGVGGTLQVMPVSIAAFSMGAVLAPGLGSSMATELADSASRYTIHRTAMELLYLPLPADLRNRTKVFVDIFMDRMGRGLGGALLALLLAAGVRDVRQIALLAMALAILWMLLSRRAAQEYLQTLRGRLAARRLDLESARIPVHDPATLALLEETSASAYPRQACYALSLLAESSNYDLRPLLYRLSRSPHAEVRGKVYEVAWFTACDDLLDRALEEIRSGTAQDGVIKPAVVYALFFSADAVSLGRDLLDHPDPRVVESALEAMRARPDWVQQLVTDAWMGATARHPSARRRALAAHAAGLRAEGAGTLESLLEDPDPAVVRAACRAAGALRDRGHLHLLIRRLDEARVRGAAIEALAAYGAGIAGTLGDILHDESVSISIRRQIPRVLRLVADQRSVDLLLQFIGDRDVSIRAAVLKALNRLRERAPHLDYGEAFVTRQILNEARHYFELHAALAPLLDSRVPRTAGGLLARTIEERCNQTIERLFRLLGLRYPQREIHAAYLAVHRSRTEQMTAALEFLETVLDHSLRRVVVPLLESSGRIADSGRDLFGVEIRDAQSAIRELIRSADPWLSACAMATAAEQQLYQLAPEIVQAGARAGAEVSEVARAAAAMLA